MIGDFVYLLFWTDNWSEVCPDEILGVFNSEDGARKAAKEYFAHKPSNEKHGGCYIASIECDELYDNTEIIMTEA